MLCSAGLMLPSPPAELLQFLEHLQDVQIAHALASPLQDAMQVHSLLAICQLPAMLC
jgi:hypothetical protein